MKENSKIIPDAPLRLWVNLCHKEHQLGLMSVGEISYQEYWEGHKYKLPKDLIYSENDKEEEYINLSQFWHKAKEIPEDMYAFIIVANKDFSFATPINLATECLHGILDDTPDKFKWNKIIRHNLRFAFWAYLKDLVPTILKEGGKM